MPVLPKTGAPKKIMPNKELARDDDRARKIPLQKYNGHPR
jgi:hypothetical protein